MHKYHPQDTRYVLNKGKYLLTTLYHLYDYIINYMTIVDVVLAPAVVTVYAALCGIVSHMARVMLVLIVFKIFLPFK